MGVNTIATETISMTKLATLSAVEATRRFREKSLSPVELMEAPDLPLRGPQSNGQRLHIYAL